MPQMAPYNWLNLYFMFTLILMYLISYIYFINKSNKLETLVNLNKNKYIWMW